MLIVRNLRSKAFFAHAVEKKGLDEKGYIVDAFVADMLWTGYSKVLLKSNNEPAMLQVLAEARKRLKEEKLEIVLDENSIPYDSQSNGGAEIGCKLLRGQVGAMWSCLEHWLQRRIPPRHPSLAWTVEHAAALRTHLVKGEDGNAACRRLRGRPCFFFLGNLWHLVNVVAMS